jgi:hypothetical protein
MIDAMPVTTRYGDDAVTLNVHSDVLDLQLAHRSVRKFAAGAVTDDQLEAMVAAELGLPPHAVAAFGLAVGVPDPTEDAGVKPRLPQAAVVHHERYDAGAADAHIADYDGRLAAYNERHGLPAGGWSGRVLTRLAGPQSMAGRHRLREVLDDLGLPSR